MRLAPQTLEIYSKTTLEISTLTARPLAANYCIVTSYYKYRLHVGQRGSGSVIYSTEYEENNDITKATEVRNILLLWPQIELLLERNAGE